jgi:phage tail-like protein
LLEWTLTPVTIRRALDQDQALFAWRAAVVAGHRDTRDVLVEVLDSPRGQPVLTWLLHDAWPLSWSGPVLDALQPGIGDGAGRAGLCATAMAEPTRDRRGLMTGIRQEPYGGFNFLVDLGTGSPTEPDAGFEERGPFSEHVDVIEYRNGNDPTNEPRKITGLATVQDISLKRGVIGSQTLYDWFDEVRGGSESASRDVTVVLLSEDRSTQVMIWKLLRARPVRYRGGPLHGRRSDLAIEELVLAYERLEVETAWRSSRGPRRQRGR